MLYIVTSTTARLVEENPHYSKVCTDEIIYQGTNLENAIKHAKMVRGMRVYTTDGTILSRAMRQITS